MFKEINDKINADISHGGEMRHHPNLPSPEVMSHPLFPHLVAAIEQAMYGKGKRHGGAETPFLEQPLFHYMQMHGRGFATGQAAKKLEEAASTRHGEAFRTEVLGAIVYAGAALIREQSTSQPEPAPAQVPWGVTESSVVPAPSKYQRRGHE